MSEAVVASARAGRGRSSFLLTLWVALLAADRVDLSGGVFGVVVTPFLLLPPAVIVLEMSRRAIARDPVRPAQVTQRYILLTLLLLATVVSSVFVSADGATSAARAALLVAHLVGSLAVALLIGDREDLGAVLARGALWGLGLFVLFDVLEVAAFFGSQPERILLGPVQISLEAFRYGLIPRLSGPVGDPNRGGFVAVFYLFLLLTFGRRGVVRSGAVVVGVALLLLTISRSAVLTAAVTVAFALLEPRWRRIPPWFVGAGLLIAAGATAALLVSPRLRETITRSAEPLSQRFSFEEESSQNHFALLERGLDVATRSRANALSGIGYGAAYLELQDFFPGNRYGNFHSLYVSMLAEAGVVAFALTVLIVGLPLVRAGRFRPLVAGAALFGVFYQATTEPAFWLLLSLAWVVPRVWSPPSVHSAAPS